MGELEKTVGYTFQDPKLLELALTHSSYAHEHYAGKRHDNERLEFLGDAVLELVSSDYLFHNYNEYPEGELTKLRASIVCEQSLAMCAEAISLGKYLRLGNGEDSTGGRLRASITSDAMEALIGAIYLDGKDIRKIKLKDLRNQIGIVQQDVYLFAGNIMENIRYGRPDATDEEVIRAAKLANAHDFIMELEEGYDTDCGQRGVKLSGGQKQRISIARVFLKNPPILVFDEATSALDNESESIVQESLEKLAKDRTTFVIAHRLSTIKNAKRICVLSTKGIEEEGTHDELLRSQGLYKKMYLAEGEHK